MSNAQHYSFEECYVSVQTQHSSYGLPLSALFEKKEVQPGLSPLSLLSTLVSSKLFLPVQPGYSLPEAEGAFCVTVSSPKMDKCTQIKPCISYIHT